MYHAPEAGEDLTNPNVWFGNRRSYWEDVRNFYDLRALMYGGVNQNSNHLRAMNARLACAGGGDAIIITKEDELLAAGIVYARKNNVRPYTFNMQRENQAGGTDVIRVNPLVYFWKQAIIDHPNYGSYVYGGGMARRLISLGELALQISANGERELLQDDTRALDITVGRKDIEYVLDTNHTSNVTVKRAAELLLEGIDEIPIALDSVNVLTLQRAELN